MKQSKHTQEPRFTRPAFPRTHAVERDRRLPQIIPARLIIRRRDIDMNRARVRRYTPENQQPAATPSPQFTHGLHEPVLRQYALLVRVGRTVKLAGTGRRLTVRQHHGEMDLHVRHALCTKRGLVRSRIHGVDDFLAGRRDGTCCGRSVGTSCKGWVILSHDDSKGALAA